jgi:hypothetical protein
VPLREGIYRFKYLIRGAAAAQGAAGALGIEWMPHGQNSVVLVADARTTDEVGGESKFHSPAGRFDPGEPQLTWDESDLLDNYRKLPSRESRDALLDALRDYTFCF